MDSAKGQPPFVRQADQDFVEVVSSDATVSSQLSELGFAKISEHQYRLSAQNETDKASIFDQLRRLGVCFSRGREWNPAEVFEHLRDLGLISGAFTEIAWTKPGEWRTRTA
jgi:hypothetical protein